MTLPTLIPQWKNNNAIAIVDRKEYRRWMYTYDQLYQFSLKAASLFQSLGLKKGDRLVLWAPNSVEYVAAIFGALSVGIIIVPLDLHSTKEFVEKVYRDTKASLLFQTLYKPHIHHRTVFVEDFLDLVSEQPLATPIAVKSGDLAQLLYTSGTTGEPKGVELTHGNLWWSTQTLQSLVEVRADSKFLSTLPLSHIFEQTVGLFYPLSLGCTIVYIQTLKASSLLQAFREEKITHAATVPRLLELVQNSILRSVPPILVAASWPLPRQLRKILFFPLRRRFGKLQYFIVGGAPVSRQLEKFFSRICLPLVVGYGQTETSGLLTANTPWKRKKGSVGKVVPGVQIRISKDDEVLARGGGITRGYYNNPQKTKELFLDGWLRTGDLGVFDKKGRLFLRGRTQERIVTSAGLKIYTEDIERILRKQPLVKDACVIGIPRGSGEEVCAVLLLSGSADPEKIMRAANEELDSGQAIKEIRVWPSVDFPRTPTQKVKKFEVQRAILAGGVPRHNHTPQSRLQGIVSLLTTKPARPSSTMSDLGLSSMDRVELVSLLEREYHSDLDENKIHAKTTIKELEEYVNHPLTPSKLLYRSWPLWWISRMIRIALWKTLLFPITRHWAKITVEGLENVRNLHTPVIFASNHQSHFDSPSIYFSLPLSLSSKTAIAVWQEYFFTMADRFISLKKLLVFYAASLFGNIYPFPQQKGYRQTLRYTGSLLNRGWNILIFPEGMRSSSKKIRPFKVGVGVLCVEMKVPVVPIKLVNVNHVLPANEWQPKKANVVVRIGKPLTLHNLSPLQATKVVEEAVRAL